MSKTHKMLKNWKTVLGRPRHRREDNTEMSVWIDSSGSVLISVQSQVS